MMPATGGLEPSLGHVNGALSGRMVKTPPQAVAVGADAATIFPLLRTNLVAKTSKLAVPSSRILHCHALRCAVPRVELYLVRCFSTQPRAGDTGTQNSATTGSPSGVRRSLCH